MFRLIFLMIVWAVMLPICAAASQEVLIVQNSRAKPYSEAILGIQSVCGAELQELVISELNGEDIPAEVQRRRPDLIIAIGMEALLKVKKIREKPIIYLMVLHPDSVLRGESNITGVSMVIPPEKQLTYFRRFLPRMQRIGLIYNPENTGRIVASATNAGVRMGTEIKSLKARKASDFPQLLDGMKGSIDAFWMLPDSTVVTPECIEYLLLFSMENKIPVLTFSDKYLKMGAFLSVEINPFKIGKQAGEMVEKILSGTDVRDIRAVDAADADVTVNYKVAEKMGIPRPKQSANQSKELK
jgi:putative ABC transport system substrate-binding protein